MLPLPPLLIISEMICQFSAIRFIYCVKVAFSLRYTDRRLLSVDDLSCSCGSANDAITCLLPVLHRSRHILVLLSLILHMMDVTCFLSPSNFFKSFLDHVYYISFRCLKMLIRNNSMHLFYYFRSIVDDQIITSHFMYCDSLEERSPNAVRSHPVSQFLCRPDAPFKASADGGITKKAGLPGIIFDLKRSLNLNL